MNQEIERQLKMTDDQRADEYIKNVALAPSTYKGDVQTAFVMAIAQERKVQQEWFKELWRQHAEYKIHAPSPDDNRCSSCGSKRSNCIC